MANGVKPDRGLRGKLNDALDSLLVNAEMSAGIPVIPGAFNNAQFVEFAGLLLETEPWRSNLTELDLFFLIHERLTPFVAKSGNEGTRVRLKEVLTADAWDSLRSDVRDYLLSLPRTYEVWFSLPLAPKWGVGELPISDRVALVEVLPSDGPSGPQGIGLNELYTEVYLKITSTGYGADRISTSAIADALSTFKQVAAFAERQFIFESRFPEPELMWPISAGCYFLDLNDRSRKFDSILFTGVLNEYLAGLTINEKRLEIFESGDSKSPPEPGRARLAKTREEKTAALSLLFRDLGVLLNLTDDTSDAIRIKTALEWEFESNRSENQTVSFVQACIGLEALLGDNDQDEPLVTRLADRCAYLLGKGGAARADLRKKFRSMYDIRSKLIHGRKARLDPHERRQLPMVGLVRMLADRATANR